MKYEDGEVCSATSARVTNYAIMKAGSKTEVPYRDGKYYPATILKTPGIVLLGVM